MEISFLNPSLLSKFIFPLSKKIFSTMSIPVFLYIYIYRKTGIYTDRIYILYESISCLSSFSYLPIHLNSFLSVLKYKSRLTSSISVFLIKFIQVYSRLFHPILFYPFDKSQLYLSLSIPIILFMENLFCKYI